MTRSGCSQNQFYVTVALPAVYQNMCPYTSKITMSAVRVLEVVPLFTVKQLRGLSLDDIITTVCYSAVQLEETCSNTQITTELYDITVITQILFLDNFDPLRVKFKLD